MKQLELKHIAPYLPYRLRAVEWYRGKQTHDEFVVDCVNWDGENIGSKDASLDSFELERVLSLRDIKPILRPLPSITASEACALLRLAYNIYIKFGSVGIISSHNELKLKYHLSNGVLICLSIMRSGGDLATTLHTIGSDCIKTTHPIPLSIYSWMFEHHFDVFGLIDKGLAVDLNQLNE